jgi:hypothetical protein
MRSLAIAVLLAAPVSPFEVRAAAAPDEHGRGDLAIDESPPFYGLIDGDSGCAPRRRDWAPAPATSDYGTAIATEQKTATRTTPGTSRATAAPRAEVPEHCS